MNISKYYMQQTPACLFQVFSIASYYESKKNHAINRNPRKQCRMQNLLVLKRIAAVFNGDLDEYIDDIDIF